MFQDPWDKCVSLNAVLDGRFSEKEWLPANRSKERCQFLERPCLAVKRSSSACDQAWAGGWDKALVFPGLGEVGRTVRLSEGQSRRGRSSGWRGQAGGGSGADCWSRDPTEGGSQGV